MTPKGFATAVLAAALAVQGPCGAADYPWRPVRIIVPFPPGNAPDLLARTLGDALTPSLGQPVVIEHRPGSNGNIAAALVAQSAADGHTLLLGQDSLIVVNPHLYSRMPLDVRLDLMPVVSLASNSFILAVNPSLPARSFAQFIELARRASPPLTYASGGNGSQHHLMMEHLKHLAGIEMLHVPYRSGSAATAATVSGEVAAMFAGVSAAGQLRAGRLRALAGSGAKRAADQPDLPAIAEYFPGYDMGVWLGLFARAGTPLPVVERLRKDINAALSAPEVIERIERSGGLRPLVTSTADFLALIERDDARFRDLIKRIGVRID
jgi:tripartite-type tricarboxylate transporter receptor subunit TctC